ncbi:hypothetical protein IEE94_11205 [Yimella sp. cx-573]|nr:hypothetical protein [Yimella sp. cx-573]
MRDLAEVFDAALSLPIRGTTYRVESPLAGPGLRLTALATISMGLAADADADLLAEALVLGQDDERNFLQLALGDAYDRMVADDLPYQWIEHAGITAWIHWTLGAESAATFWESGGKLAAAKTPPTPTASTSTGAASTTKRPGSGSGTTSRPKSGTSGTKKRKRKRAKRSH